jgi:FkbM family methyltransferase
MSYKNLLKKNFNKVFRLVRDLKLMVVHRSLNPSKIALPSGQSLYINWHEPRGHAILRCGGKGQAFIKNIWSSVLYQMLPEVVLDCGANYGELIFSTKYNETQIAYAVEADPALIKWLNKSHNIHPDKEKIKVIHSLLGSTSGENQTFYVDKKWSGRSTALVNHGFKDFYKIEIPTVSLDDLVEDENYLSKGVLFKIDVEGYEPFVLEGMKKIISNSKWSVGIIEFNLSFFNKVDFSIERYISTINENFEVALIDENSINKISNFSIEELKKSEINFNDILVYSRNISETINSILKIK